ncbi:MAG TPA: DUF1800 domain-containing protein [Pyrinomonadaceae bacterium]|nr:DUF1800 domain-containing protein [Pyrinomonadaceae bacterium]
MKISNQFLAATKPARLNALFLLFALLASTFVIEAGAQNSQKTQVRLSEDQRILHVLNRLGFGARPGDVERVRATGLDNYINQQLNPEKISDSLAEAKVQNLATLNMTTAELYEKFPQPGQLLRQLQRRGELPDDLAGARENRVNGKANTAPGPDAKNDASREMEGVMSAKEGMPQSSAAQPGTPNSPANPLENEKYRELLREYYAKNGLQLPQRIMGELQASRILRAVYSDRQLQEVMVDFWSNHFNVFAGKGADRWLLTAYDRDTIRPNALGRFQDLLLATAKSPAMLFYLDNFQSVSPNAQVAPRGDGRPRRQPDSLLGLFMNRRQDRNPNTRQQQPGAPPPNAQRQRRGINENYARELMELHTLGVEGGYTQKDVQEVARCFTGWTIFAPRGGGAAVAVLIGEAGRANAGAFFFNARVHDDGEKVVLGQKISAGGGINDGLRVLDILARHPSTAKFIAMKLVRHFVSDTPPPTLVARVAATYQKSDGDIREMLKTIFLSPEFNSPEAYRAKIKRPFELAISAVRALGADTNGGPQFHQWIARMGEPLYGFQTPNGYSDTAEAWVNTGALLERLNFGLSLASNRIPGTRVDLKRFADAPGTDNRQVMTRFLDVIVAGEISPKTKQTLLEQMNEQPITIPPPPAPARTQGEGEMNAGPRPRQQQMARQASITDPVTKMVGLILGSPEFQRQ